jgi:hypothetical protein
VRPHCFRRGLATLMLRKEPARRCRHAGNRARWWRRWTRHGRITVSHQEISAVHAAGTHLLGLINQVLDLKRMEKTLPIILQWDESFDIGSDTLTGVNDADYKPPFPFTGKLNKLTIKVDRPQLSPEDIKKFEAAMREKAKAD